MEKQEVLSLGVVVEQRAVDHPWADEAWTAVAVITGAAVCDPAGEWPEIRKGDDWTHYHGGTLPLELFRTDTEAYKVNLSQDPPRIFVVLRSGEDMDCDHEVAPFLVTASPYEAQDYLDSGEEVVEAVAMPPDVIAFIQAFVDQHHVDEPFIKRKRDRYDTSKGGFGRRESSRPGARRGGLRGGSND